MLVLLYFISKATIGIISPTKGIMNKKCTTHRGVEAKDIDIDAGPDQNVHLTAGRAENESSRMLHGDDSSSYIQVVVHKHQRPNVRLPVASSPELRTEPTAPHYALQAPGCDGRALPAMTCPAYGALQSQWPGAKTDERHWPPAVHGNGDAAEKQNQINNKKKSTSLWANLCSVDEAQHYGPDRVEMYYFERNCDSLYALGAGRETYMERTARALARPAAVLFAELLAVPRILIHLPISVFLQVNRCVLTLVRDAVVGAVQATSDLALKPALVLMFNAVLRPPLVLVAQTLGALRDVGRPVWLALADALEPLAGLLARVRLLHVERHCACARHV